MGINLIFVNNFAYGKIKIIIADNSPLNVTNSQNTQKRIISEDKKNLYGFLIHLFHCME